MTDTAATAPALAVDDLRHNGLFAQLDDGQLAWLAEVGEQRVLTDGEVIFAEGEPASRLVVLVQGEIVITKVVDGREEVLTRHSTESDPDDHDNKPTAAHGFTGEMPLLAGEDYIATAAAVGPTRVALYSRETFMEMMVRCPQVCQVLLPVLAWRIHSSEVQAGQRAKVNALGTLAAGIAHELNNPAAAIVRAAGDLSTALADLEGAAARWATDAGPEETAALSAAATQLQRLPVVLAGRDGIADAESEEEMEDWLDDHEVDNQELVGLLVDRQIGADWLEELCSHIPEELLSPALSYLTRSLAAHSLVGDITDAGQRISAIVAATKEYTNLDRAPEQEFDINQGIEATLTVLRPKLGRITVHRDYRPDVPRVIGFPTELNQVWTNLIDNAIDAMDGTGELWLATRTEGNCVLVEVGDSGPGIPEEIRARIFEPFFTTKDIGKGTGLGLHLSHRIVTQRHHGTMTLRSQPGRTRFLIRIPANLASGAVCSVPVVSDP